MFEFKCPNCQTLQDSPIKCRQCGVDLTGREMDAPNMTCPGCHQKGTLRFRSEQSGGALKLEYLCWSHQPGYAAWQF